jgi:hypothetical protein
VWALQTLNARNDNEELNKNKYKEINKIVTIKLDYHSSECVIDYA